MNDQRVLPVTADHDTAPFWAAARDERLVVRYCDHCDAPVHLPRGLCPRCHQPADGWREASGRGRVYSWTVVEHQVHPGHPTPYTSVLIELEDLPSVRLLGALDGRHELAPGQPMEVWFEHLDDVSLPQWRPAPA